MKLSDVLEENAVMRRAARRRLRAPMHKARKQARIQRDRPGIKSKAEEALSADDFQRGTGTHRNYDFKNPNAGKNTEVDMEYIVDVNRMAKILYDTYINDVGEESYLKKLNRFADILNDKYQAHSAYDHLVAAVMSEKRNHDQSNLKSNASEK